MAKRNWKLIWQDSFMQGKLVKWDPLLWNLKGKMHSAGWNYGAIDYWDESQVGVSNQKLVIKAKHLDSPVVVSQPAYGGTKSYEYVSGCVNTMNHLQVGAPCKVEGYIRLAASAPNVVANWPAFWMFGKHEIDIVEGLGGRGMYHYHTYPNPADPENMLGGTYSQPVVGWHRFGVIWDVGRLQFTLDGKVDKVIKDDRIIGDDLYIIIGLNLKGLGGPLKVPSALFCKWVRVWKPA